ncbi:sensor histidine kinase [Actinomadura sp. HBU206391]|uniref:sensor histidine kinase n=1 Tax=Actinomadura sp. HBU206391 TaxID=2731692 RepID=UPI0016502C79|nr:histidine kinase [Actinomadura sp. HBU206391]MBC6461097.1 histidine kinase [Actinomadura sp. HBU206391]
MRDGSIDHGTGLASFRRYTWWAVPGTTACLLVLFVGDWMLDGDRPAWALGLGAAALAIEVVSSVVLLSRRLALPPAADARPGRLPAGWLIAGCAAAAVLAALPLAMRDHGLWAVAPAMMVAITATYLPPHPRRRLIVGAAVLALLPGGVVSLVDGGQDRDLLYAALFPAGLVAFTAWTLLGPLWAWDTAGRLNEARRLSAELAVKDERLRFAADLHDIQGHHLQVIALKSELAARLAQIDPERAAAEMREVQRLSTDALRDTRAVVQGYRRTTLDDEIANATRVLAAADIDARMSLEPAAVAGRADLATSTRHLLGLVMREATTNVLRHSRARHAEVDYRVIGGFARLRVINDGADERTVTTSGTGLRTLSERLRAAGGELTWDHDGDRFVIAASLPAKVEAR